MFKRRAVFLDRDGVLNRLVVRDGRAVAPRALKEFALLPGVREAVGALRRAAWLVVVVTNQPDIARGQLDLEELWRMHDRLRQAVPVDAVYTCPHDDLDRCVCRKPRPGLLWRASRRWRINLASSFLVGDTWKDMAAGKAAGCTTVLIISPQDNSRRVVADLEASDLRAAAEMILGQFPRPQWRSDIPHFSGF